MIKETANVLRNQVRREQEKVAEYRKVLKWAVLAVEQSLISKEDIIEEIEAVLDYTEDKALPRKQRTVF